MKYLQTFNETFAMDHTKTGTIAKDLNFLSSTSNSIDPRDLNNKENSSIEDAKKRGKGISRRKEEADRLEKEINSNSDE